MEEQQHGTELPGLNIMNIQLDFWGGGWQRTIKKTPWKCDQGGMMKKCIWPQCALCLEFMTLSSMGKPVINLKSKRVCTAGMTTGIPTYKELPLSKHLKIKN